MGRLYYHARMAAYVALLRGINVGGNNLLPMKQLVELCKRAGAAEVQTYIQSGNLAFQATAAVAKQLPQKLGAAIERAFGFRPPLTVRSGAELEAITTHNPYLAAGVAADLVHVGFLTTRPTAAAIASLEPNRSPGDAFAVVGREIYFHLPRGVGKTKLTNAYFDKALATTCTLRNWRTVLALRDLART